MTENGYSTIQLPFDEIPQIPSFRMELQWTLDQLLGYYSTWSATNRFIMATGQNPLEPLSGSLEKVWGDPEKPRRVEWPLVLRVAHKPRVACL